jgi:hypothetical protein
MNLALHFKQVTLGMKFSCIDRIRNPKLEGAALGYAPPPADAHRLATRQPEPRAGIRLGSFLMTERRIRTAEGLLTLTPLSRGLSFGRSVAAHLLANQARSDRREQDLPKTYRRLAAHDLESGNLLILLASPTGFEPVLPP